MKKKNLKNFKLSKSSISNLTAQNNVIGGAEGDAAEPVATKFLCKSNKWWLCPHKCTAYC